MKWPFLESFFIMFSLLEPFVAQKKKQNLRVANNFNEFSLVENENEINQTTETRQLKKN